MDEQDRVFNPVMKWDGTEIALPGVLEVFNKFLLSYQGKRIIWWELNGIVWVDWESRIVSSDNYSEQNLWLLDSLLRAMPGYLNRSTK